MDQFRMLKNVAMVGACVLILSACGAADKLVEVSYRTHHLMFEKREYEKSPGVLMRASVGAWGRYNEAEKVAAIMDYYIDPEARLKSDSLRFQWGLGVENVLDSLSSPEFKKPVPQELSREEAQKRVQCLNGLFGEISEKYRQFLLARYPLFKAEAQCSAFLSRDSVPTECIGWELSASRETHGEVTVTGLRVGIVNRCAS